MKKLHICIIDLIHNAFTRELYPRLMYANYMSIMPQVVGVWCKEEGHNVHYILYGGFQDLLKEIPEKIDLVFISAFTFTAQLSYALSNMLRSKGIVTVLGGPHARSYPEDACKYFDFVLGLTDKKLVCDVLNDCTQHRPDGIYLTNIKQPLSIPGLEERWEFIEKTFRNSPIIKIVPMIASFGCPYKCDFCCDSLLPFQPLDYDLIRNDLRFVLRKMKRPHVGWYDPNFGIQFNALMNTIEEAVPPDSIDFIAECSLSILTEPHVKRLKHNGFKVIMPGIETWYNYGNKANAGNKTGMEKVKQIAEQMNMVQRQIPYVQANFLLGQDGDTGTAPFELTKLFIDMAPGVYPSFALINSFGRSATAGIKYQRENRVLPFPFHVMRSVHTLNIRPKNYTWLNFYDLTIDLLRYSFSSRTIYNRFRAVKMALPRWLGLILSLSVGGAGKIKYHTAIRHKLLTDTEFKDFFEQKTLEIPAFFKERVKRDLGPLWKWLPEGALYHDPNACLKTEVQYS